MNSAIVVAFAAVLAVANAGFLAAPAVAYSSPLSAHNAYAVSSSTGIVRGAPLVAAYPAHHTLVRVARGLIAGAPLAYAAAPAVIAAPTVSRTYHGAGIGSTSPVVYGGLPHIRVARGLVGAAPVAYASPIAYSAPVAVASPVVHSVAYSAVAHPALAYAAHPLTYGAPVVKSVHAAPVLL